jgi:hypothetical protein
MVRIRVSAIRSASPASATRPCLRYTSTRDSATVDSIRGSVDLVAQQRLYCAPSLLDSERVIGDRDRSFSDPCFPGDAGSGSLRNATGQVTVQIFS